MKDGRFHCKLIIKIACLFSSKHGLSTRFFCLDFLLSMAPSFLPAEPSISVFPRAFLPNTSFYFLFLHTGLILFSFYLHHWKMKVQGDRDFSVLSSKSSAWPTLGLKRVFAKWINQPMRFERDQEQSYKTEKLYNSINSTLGYLDSLFISVIYWLLGLKRNRFADTCSHS